MNTTGKNGYEPIVQELRLSLYDGEEPPAEVSLVELGPAEVSPAELGVAEVRPDIFVLVPPLIPRLDALLQVLEMLRVRHRSRLPL